MTLHFDQSQAPNAIFYSPDISSGDVPTLLWAPVVVPTDDGPAVPFKQTTDDTVFKYSTLC